jgi:DNA-binding transcriptional LysR family regulator
MLQGHIEAFAEVAHQGTVHRAAERLLIGQPALTARLQALEREVGTPLFRRTRRGMRLTAAGRTFLPYAERALDAIVAGTTLVRDQEQGIVGELCVGVVAAVGTYVLPELLAHFNEAHPDVHEVVRTGQSEEIIDMVVRGEVDVGLTRQVKDPRVVARPLYDDELLLVALPGHPFAEAGRVDVTDLHNAHLILFDRLLRPGNPVNSMLRAAGIGPRGVTEVDSIEIAKHMVLRGLGVSMLPATAVADSLATGALCEIGWSGAGTIRRRIVAVEQRGVHARSAAFVAFAALLLRVPELVPGAHPVAVSG